MSPSGGATPAQSFCSAHAKTDLGGVGPKFLERDARSGGVSSSRNVTAADTTANRQITCGIEPGHLREFHVPADVVNRYPVWNEALGR